MRHIITAVFIFTATLVLSFSSYKISKADDYDIVLNSIYEQMVTEKKNSAYVETDINIDTNKLIDRIEQTDKEDTLYDGVSLVCRGSDFSIKKIYI